MSIHFSKWQELFKYYIIKFIYIIIYINSIYNIGRKRILFFKLQCCNVDMLEVIGIKAVNARLETLIAEGNELNEQIAIIIKNLRE